ncbi:MULTISPECIES: ParM/StbA family protein [Herbaspirillum]|uniref:ParM/StbA family protein n=2 Tax=Herbaspirillum huttiense TaxID=863372 RepID=A0AAJ2H580_9BURK|nr:MULTISPECIES: ParM/StbA family protein [Herbaspirillum]MDR9837009.1 ParM/StbA family protein [Herbaspirillum huttiense]
MQKPAVGLDIGRSAVKVCAYAEGKYYEVIFPSVVTEGFTLSDEGTARKADLDTVELEGKVYFTGDTARLQGNAASNSGLVDDWHATTDYRVLIASALKRLAAQGVMGLGDAYLIIGAPSKLYRTKKEQIIEATRKVCPAAIIKLLPQPMGAFLYHGMDKTGLPIVERMKVPGVAVVDVGHYTTDFLLLLEQQNIERAAESCEGISIGAGHLARLLAEGGYEVSLLEASEAIHKKQIFQYGQVIDVTGQVEAALSFISQKIISGAESALSKDVRKANWILIAGGGAEVVYPHLRAKWPNCVLLPDARMSVAKGFCYYGIGQQRVASRTA